MYAIIKIKSIPDIYMIPTLIQMLKHELYRKCTVNQKWIYMKIAKWQFIEIIDQQCVWHFHFHYYFPIFLVHFKMSFNKGVILVQFYLIKVYSFPQLPASACNQAYIVPWLCNTGTYFAVFIFQYNLVLVSLQWAKNGKIVQ